MNTNVTVQRNTAMEENSKIKVLSNEMTRRLLNTKEDLGSEVRIAVVNDYCQKLCNSGYSNDKIRRIVLCGIKSYERKLRMSKTEGGRRIHRSSKQSGASRYRKKVLGKTEWYREGGKQDDEKEEGADSRMSAEGGRMPGGTGRTKKKDIEVLKTKTVLFVEHTPNGELAKSIRETLKRVEHIVGFKVKVVERAGTAVKSFFSLTRMWEGAPCGRLDCTTCSQVGEEVIACNKRNLVYENICVKCNPTAVTRGELKNANTNTPSLYVGETARSIYERGREHWEDYKSKSSDSHIYKHHVLHHNSEGEPEFVMKVVGYHSTALSRQVGEAVRIGRRGADSLLNSKSEFNRCSIVRLTLEKEENKTKEDQQGESMDGATEDMWEGRMLQKREESDRFKRRELGRPDSTTTAGKRREQGAREGRTRPTKRRKHETLGEDWGEKGTPVEERGSKGMTVTVVVEKDDSCTTPVEVRGSKGVTGECGGGPDDLCTGFVRPQYVDELRMKPKNDGDVHKWRKEVNVKRTWCKLGSGLFGWRRQKVTSWRHEETGSLMTSQEYTSYVKGNTQKGDTFKNFPFNSTLRAALPTEDSLDGVQARIRLQETSQHTE